MAFVATSKPQIKGLAAAGRKDAQRLLSLRENPERTLSILQIGITLLNSVSAAVGGLSAANHIEPHFEHMGFSKHVSEFFAVGVVVFPITVLSVVVGELVPKTIALKRSLSIALWGASIVIHIDRFFRPIVNILEKTTKVILTLLFPRSKAPETSVPEDISLSELKNEHRQYVFNLVDLERKTTRDAMIPWYQVTFVRTVQTADDVANVVLSSGHTRLPVLTENTDALAGVLHTKEFLSFYRAGGVEWINLVRPAVTFSENDSLIKALRKLQETRRHMGMVTTREARVLGVITLEDIIEEVVGEIYDEDDDGTLKKLLSLESLTKTYSGSRRGSGKP